MILHAEINQYGRLNATIPKLLWGKKVIISISEETDSESSNRDNSAAQSQSQSKREHDETTYLLSSPANERRLEQARKEFEKDQWIEVEDLDELFK
jgi:hypothetical protein